MTIRKGQVLNPTGRNQKKPISEAIRSILTRNENDPLDDKPKTIAHKIALRLVQDAVAGENYLPACKEVMDRVEGKPKQTVVGDDDEDAIKLDVVITQEQALKAILGNG